MLICKLLHCHNWFILRKMSKVLLTNARVGDVNLQTLEFNNWLMLCKMIKSNE